MCKYTSAKRPSGASIVNTDGTKTPYFTRTLEGRLEDVSFDLRVIDSKWHPRAPHSAYFGCTDFDLETQDALQIYASRWGCETDSVYLKTRLGLGDFRVRPYEAVDKYVAVVHLGWAYVQWSLMRERSAQIQNPADIIRQHRDEHAIDWLTGACQEAVATGDVQAVLNRFLRLAACRRTPYAKRRALCPSPQRPQGAKLRLSDRLLDLDDAPLNRHLDQLAPVVQAELLHQVGAVRLDGL